MMKATIEKDVLVVRIPLTAPTASSTGKSLLVATSHGGQKCEGLTIQGKPVTISLNAFIPAK